MLKAKSKSSVLLGEMAGRPIFSMGGFLHSVGWIPVPSQRLQLRTPFPVQGPRINLLGSVPRNGIATSGDTAAAGVIVQTDSLSAGQYRFDFTIPIPSGTTDQFSLVISDRNDNQLFRVLIHVSSPASTTAVGGVHTINMPIGEGNRVKVVREISSGNLTNCGITWTYLNAYNSNDPLSLAAFRVQATEPQYPGQSTSDPIGIPPGVAIPGPEAPYSGGGDGSGGDTE